MRSRMLSAVPRTIELLPISDCQLPIFRMSDEL
jgi:hypothetical protein